LRWQEVTDFRAVRFCVFPSLQPTTFAKSFFIQLLDSNPCKLPGQSYTPAVSSKKKTELKAKPKRRDFQHTARHFEKMGKSWLGRQDSDDAEQKVTKGPEGGDKTVLDGPEPEIPGDELSAMANHRRLNGRQIQLLAIAGTIGECFHTYLSHASGPRRSGTRNPPQSSNFHVNLRTHVTTAYHSSYL
jgi:hypothetical protein